MASEITTGLEDEAGVGRSRSKHGARLAALALAPALFLLVILFYRKIALTNLILVDYDLLTYFYPYKEAAAAAIREGRFPLWNPYLFTGAPFMANPQTAMFYPLNLPGYALAAPMAVKYSVIFHVFLAGVFTYAFGRSSLGLGKVGALSAAICFMFGGFLTQQVGHINQLNAAVWLPLVLLLFDLAWQRQKPLFALLGGFALSAQVLAGHSQETFLLLVAFGLYAVFRIAQSVNWRMPLDFRPAIWPVASFAIMAGIGAGLSAAQLIPTLELSRESIRGGGLPYREAVSFSLPPWLLARSLLPAFKDSPFSEYIAYSGIIPLFLAAYAVGRRKVPPMAWFWLGLGLLALFLAIGGYNPLYELVYKLAPPLRLFRVPSRWLYLYAFALAPLAGMGADRLISADSVKSRARSLLRVLVWVTGALIPIGVIQLAAAQTKEGVSPEVFAAWAGLIVIAAAVVHLMPRANGKVLRATILLGLLGGELFVAGSFLNSNTTSAPQAESTLRPTVAQLLQDPGLYRVLSISRTDFDPGDLADLKSIFGASLDKDGAYQLLVALKHQEALSPNIPMKYGIGTLDGYDGGVLPLRRYVDFKALLLDGAPLREAAASRPNQADALLRDQLAGIPDTTLLGLLNVKYIVTDKQADVWQENVYYDLSTPGYAYPAAPFGKPGLPGFQATAIGLVYRLEGSAPPPGPLAELAITGGSGRDFRTSIAAQDSRTLPKPNHFYVRLKLDGPHDGGMLSVRYLGTEGRLVLAGISLIDERTGASEPVTLDPNLRLVQSGDLKVYENLRWQPKARIEYQPVWARDDQETLAVIRARQQKQQGGPVLTGTPPPGLPAQAVSLPPGEASGKAEIFDYRPEKVLVQTESATPGYLVLADSYFPGWRAYVDGQETPVMRAEYIFRAVYLPAGSHQVEFRYEPGSVRWGLAASLATLVLSVLGGAGWTLWRRRDHV